MGKQGLTRRELTAAIAAALPSRSAIGPVDGSAWASLVHDLRIANERWAAAMASLNKAERRYFALPARRRRAPQPAWYVAAQQSEAQAADQVEKLHLQIAFKSLEHKRPAARPLPSRYGCWPPPMEALSTMTWAMPRIWCPV